jgi:hypothetical protein
MADDGDGQDKAPVTFAGQSYGPFIDRQLDEERARKSSLEQRALAVITTSGVLATLLAGFVALAGRQAASIDGVPKVLVVLSGGCFVGAAVGGLLANVPRDYQEAAVAWLKKFVEDQVWRGDDRSLADQRIAQVQLGTLDEARSVNDTKARIQTWAMGFEVAAVVFLAASVAWIILLPHDGPPRAV